MTADERIEALLNRAGQTISDLPGPLGYTAKQEAAAMEAAADFGGDDVLILHLTDVIDRMETALENVFVERDWMIRTMREIRICDTCWFHGQDAPECDSCLDPDDNQYSYSGVPEDWRVDND